jgi:predicted Zn-dependent peptidase
LQQRQEDAGAMAEIMLRQRMYGTHPYGKPAFITKKSLQAIQQEDLQTFWHNTTGPQRQWFPSSAISTVRQPKTGQ